MHLTFIKVIKCCQTYFLRTTEFLKMIITYPRTPCKWSIIQHCIPRRKINMWRKRYLPHISMRIRPEQSFWTNRMKSNQRYKCFSHPCVLCYIVLILYVNKGIYNLVGTTVELNSCGPPPLAHFSQKWPFEAINSFKIFINS